MTTRLVCFIGVIGSGKDFRANALAQDGYTRVDFKDELLALCSDIAGYDVRVDYEWFKENIVGVRRPANKFMEQFLVNDRKAHEAEHAELMTGRRLLQRLGSEGMRSRDQEYWVKAFVRKAKAVLDAGGKVATADCRFENEAAAVRALDPRAKFIFCNYRSPRYNPSVNHQSEHLAQSFLAAGLADGEEI